MGVKAEDFVFLSTCNTILYTTRQGIQPTVYRGPFPATGDDLAHLRSSVGHLWHADWKLVCPGA